MAEIWDVYDGYRRAAGRTHTRGEPLAYGDYHLVVFAWVVNSAGEILMSRRHPCKSYGGFLECTGGCALAGETSRQAAVRELYEEVGVAAREREAALVRSVRRVDDFADTFIFCRDMPISSMRPQANEVTELRWIDLASYDRLRTAGEVVPSAMNFRLLYEALRSGRPIVENMLSPDTPLP